VRQRPTTDVTNPRDFAIFGEFELLSY